MYACFFKLLSVCCWERTLECVLCEDHKHIGYSNIEIDCRARKNGRGNDKGAMRKSNEQMRDAQLPSLLMYCTMYIYCSFAANMERYSEYPCLNLLDYRLLQLDPFSFRGLKEKSIFGRSFQPVSSRSIRMLHQKSKPCIRSNVHIFCLFILSWGNVRLLFIIITIWHTLAYWTKQRCNIAFFLPSFDFAYLRRVRSTYHLFYMNFCDSATILFFVFAVLP